MRLPDILYPLMVETEIADVDKETIQQLLIIAGSPVNTWLRSRARRIIKQVTNAIGVEKLRALAPRLSLVDEVMQDE